MFLIYWPDFASSRHTSIFKMFDYDKFFDPTFDFSIPDNDELGFNGYPFEGTNGEPSTRAAQTGGFDPEAALNDLDAAGIENWWLAPRSDGDASRYAGSTLLNSFQNELPGSYDTQTGYALEIDGASTSASHCSLSSVMNSMNRVHR